MSTRTKATFRGKFTNRQHDTYIMELMDRMDKVEWRLQDMPPTLGPLGNRNNDNPGPSNNNDGINAQRGKNRHVDVENFVNGEMRETCRQFMERIM